MKITGNDDCFMPDDIQFSVELASEVQKNIAFLHKIEKEYPMLYEDFYAIHAVRRYEQYWLPLLAEYRDSTLTPPLDIHWAWHCHMLAPVQYRADCKKLIGFVPDHTYCSNQSKSRGIWKEFCCDQEPYNYLKSKSSHHETVEFVSRIGYDILAAMKRQRSFNYQVSLPHYGDEKFLNTAVERYKKFLHLAHVYRGEVLVPAYDIDLVWHCHQVHPVAYFQDTQQILGKMLNHDDSMGDKAFESCSDTEISSIDKHWEDHFHEKYLVPGAMYRGHDAPNCMEFMFQEVEKEQDCARFGIKDSNFAQQIKFSVQATMELEVGKFQEIVADEDLKNILEYFHRRTNNNLYFDFKCYTADHKLLDVNKGILYYVKVVIPSTVGFPPLVLISDQQKRCISMAHLTSSNELPSPDQVCDEEIPALSTDHQYAMIVMNKAGDSNIIKCTESGFLLFTILENNDISLNFEITDLKSNKVQKLDLLTANGSFDFTFQGLTVNLNSTMLECSTKFSAENLAVALCVPFLYCLKIKPGDYSPLNLMNAFGSKIKLMKTPWKYNELSSACSGKCSGACANIDSGLGAACKGGCTGSCSSQCTSMLMSACSGKCSGACSTTE